MAAKKETAGTKKQSNRSKKTASNKKQKKQSRNKPISTLETQIKKQKKVYNYKGEPLSTLQAKFIDNYIELGNQRQAVIKAGYRCKNPDYQANALLRIPKVIDEVNWRMEQMHKQSIATSEEILEYYTKVMRGQEKDQFGLEAPLAERTKAASELAKRLIDIPQKLEGKVSGNATVQISLDWTGMEVDNNEPNESESVEK